MLSLYWQFSSLSDSEHKVAELVGVSEFYMQCKMTGRSSKKFVSNLKRWRMFLCSVVIYVMFMSTWIMNTLFCAFTVGKIREDSDFWTFYFLKIDWLITLYLKFLTETIHIKLWSRLLEHFHPSSSHIYFAFTCIDNVNTPWGRHISAKRAFDIPE